MEELQHEGVPMKTSTALLAMAALLSAAAPSSAKEATEAAEEEITLKNGSLLIIFGDGEMAMRDWKGLPYRMAEGQTMETRDGRIIRMGRDNPFRKSKAEQNWEAIFHGP
jgi:hypothetical protein